MKLVVGDSQRSTSVLTPPLRRDGKPVLSAFPPCPPPRRFLPFTFPLGGARGAPLCVPYRIVKPLFSVRTAGQKESSCLRLLVNPRVSPSGDSHDYVIQLGRGLQLLRRFREDQSLAKRMFIGNFFFFFFQETVIIEQLAILFLFIKSSITDMLSAQAHMESFYIKSLDDTGHGALRRKQICNPHSFLVEFSYSRANDIDPPYI